MTELFVGLPGAGDVEILGTADALRVLARVLAEATARESELEVVPTDPFGPKRILARTDDGLVRIEVTQGALAFIGSANKLGVIAKNIAFLAASKKCPDHLHIEYYPGHPQLHPASMRLLVRVGPEPTDK